MNSNRRSTPRKSFKPQLDLLEDRNLLSGVFGDLAAVGSLQGVPIQAVIPDLRLLPGEHQGHAGLSLSTHYLETIRGGSAVTYTVALTTQPTSDVIVTVGQVDPLMRPQPGVSPLTITPTTLTFTHNNWNSPQTVTVAAPADSAGPRDQFAWLIHSVRSDDPNYQHAGAPPVAVAVLDDRPPVREAGVVFSKDCLKVSKAEGDSFTVELASKPTANVTLTFTQETRPGSPADGAAPLVLSPESVTFTPENWDHPQTINVLLPVRASAAGPLGGPGFRFVSLVPKLTSDDANYNGLDVPGIGVLIRNGAPVHEAGFVVSKTFLELKQGGSDSYTVALASKPTANVTVTIEQETRGKLFFARTDEGSGPLNVSPTTLTFTPETWNQPQTVTVSATNPTATTFDRRSVLLVQKAASDDPNYDHLFVPAVGVVQDGVPKRGSLVVSTNHLDVTPGGPSVSYTVALASEPTADVIVIITEDQPPWLLGGPGPQGILPLPLGGSPQLTIRPGVLTFTHDNWNVPQIVTISAPAAVPGQALPVSGIASLRLQVSSEDPNYDHIPVLPINVTVRDGPVVPVGVRTSENHLELTAHNHWTDSLTLALASQPTAPVAVTISQGHIGGPMPLEPASASVADNQQIALTITPTTLTFTPDDWNRPQVVQVSLQEGSLGLLRPLPLLTFTLGSTDANYNNLWVPPVSVAILPDRLPPVEPAAPTAAPPPAAAAPPPAAPLPPARRKPRRKPGVPRTASLGALAIGRIGRRVRRKRSQP